jgi:hypothetical protein
MAYKLSLWDSKPSQNQDISLSPYLSGEGLDIELPPYLQQETNPLLEKIGYYAGGALKKAFLPFTLYGEKMKEATETPLGPLGSLTSEHPSISPIAPVNIMGKLGRLGYEMGASLREPERSAWEPLQEFEEEEVMTYAPGGEKYEEYEELPWWQQALYELPAWAISSGVGASGVRAALAPTVAKGGIRGGAAATARGALLPIEAAERGAGLLVKGAIQLPLKGISIGSKKIFDIALNKGLDKILVREGIRGNQANKVLAYFLERNDRKLFTYAQNNLLKRVHPNMAQSAAEKGATMAAEDTVKQAEPLLLQATKEFKAIKPEVKVTPKVEPLGLELSKPSTKAMPLENKLPYQLPELSRYKAKKQALAVADELAESLGSQPSKYPPVTEVTFKKPIRQRMSDKLGGILARTYRVERLLLRADNFTENGKMQQAFWRPVEVATNRKITEIDGAYNDFKSFIEESGIGLPELITQKTVIDGIPLTTSERIGIYLHSLNNDNLVHVVFGNNIPMKTIDRVVASLTPEERAVAGYFQKYFENEGPKISEIHKQMTGKPMDVVENYFPIQIQRKADEIGELEFNQIIVDEKKLRYASKWASSRIRKGFTLPRTGKAMQPVDLDAFNVWVKHLEGASHYTNFSPIVRDLQWLLTNPKLKRSIIQEQGLPVYQVYDKWLKDIAQTNPLKVTSHGESIVRQMRVNAVTAVLGFNLTTAMKQFPSFITGMAEIGEVDALKGLFTALTDWKETDELLKKFAPQIYKRHFEREIAEAEALKKVSAKVMGKLSTRQVFMFLTTTIDKIAVRGLWRGGFDKMIGQGATEEEAAEYASKAIRKTQPYFGAKDLPEYYRSGEMLKALTMFTNQLNQYWNYYIFDIYGKTKAGHISKAQALKRIIEAFIIPALVIGAISDSHLPRKKEDYMRSLGGMALATVPLIGSVLSSAIRGFYGSQGIITLELLDRLQNFAYQANKGKWDKVGWMAPELVGYAGGIPVAQPRRTIQAMINIASGKSDDWLELIWGEYTREKARIDPYQQIEDEIWAQYPGLKGKSDKIKQMEKTDPVKARQMLYEDPDGSRILEARRRIAIAQNELKREESLEERQKITAGR